MTFDVGYTSIYVAFGALVFATIIYAFNSIKTRVPKGNSLLPLWRLIYHVVLFHMIVVLTLVNIIRFTPSAWSTSQVDQRKRQGHAYFPSWMGNIRPMGKGVWSVADNASQKSGPYLHIGGIVHVNVYGKHMIYLNTLEAAKELLEKRSSIYSDRFEFTMLLDLWVSLVPEHLALPHKKLGWVGTSASDLCPMGSVGGDIAGLFSRSSMLMLLKHTCLFI